MNADRTLPLGRPASSWVRWRERLSAIDWRTICIGLPKRRFTPEELQRAVPEPPSWALRMGVMANIGLPLISLVGVGGLHFPPLALAVMGAAVVGMLWALERIWRDPSAPFTRWAYYVAPALLGLLIGVQARGASQVTREGLMMAMLVVAVMAAGLWIAIRHRHHTVVLRLRELDEQQRAIDMARRLAAAQIQPHFLFNSLASLQHWVQLRDERAAPMLEALTGYLRATLPMFEKEQLTLGEEMEAVQRYLAVMQARLGDRLSFEATLEPGVANTLLPPGVLLTLVENAVEHGVQPQLAGGRVVVSGRRGADGLTQVEVSDSGPGLSTGAADPFDPQAGVGLRNTRQRLAQAYGGRASLSLENAAAGGCVARLALPAPG